MGVDWRTPEYMIREEVDRWMRGRGEKSLGIRKETKRGKGRRNSEKMLGRDDGKMEKRENNRKMATGEKRLL